MQTKHNSITNFFLLFIAFLYIFTTPNQNIMKTKNILPVWYGGNILKDCSAVLGVEHLSLTGFLQPKTYANKRNTRGANQSRKQQLNF